MGALPHIPYCKSVTISPDESQMGPVEEPTRLKLSLDPRMTYYLQILLSSTPDLQDYGVPTVPRLSLFRYPCCQDNGDSQTQVDCTVHSTRLLGYIGGSPG